MNDLKRLFVTNLTFYNEYNGHIVLKVQFNNIILNAILDTGSTSSFITNGAIEILDKGEFVDDSIDDKVSTISSDHNICGILWYIEFVIENVCFASRFKVLQMDEIQGYDIILGLDFIAEYGIIIDYLNRNMVCRGLEDDPIIRF